MALTLLLLGNWGSRQDADSLGPFPHQLWGPLFTTKLLGRKGRPEGPWQAAGPRRARVPRSQDAPSGTSPASLRGARAVTPVVALSAALCRSRERAACTARGGPAGPRGPVRHALSTPSQPTLPFPLGRARSCHTGRWDIFGPKSGLISQGNATCIRFWQTRSRSLPSANYILQYTDFTSEIA